MTVKPFSRLNYAPRNYNVVSAVMVPVYSVSSSVASLNEGSAVTYTISTQYVLDGTVLYWTTSGTTTSSDFSDGLTSGSVTMTNGTATVVRTLTNDIITEGSETIVFELRTGSTSGTIVATSPSVTVYDTSVLFITPDTSSVNEGGSVTWTINAVGFGTGTLYYTNSGTTSAGDFSDNLNSGSIAITSDNGTLTKTLLSDLSTEGSETIIIQIRTGSTAGTIVGTSNTVTVADTSYSTQAYSVYFNTAASGLVIAHNTALDLTSGNFTIECWYYKNTASANGEYLFGKGGNASTRYHSYAFQSTGVNTYGFLIGDNTGPSTVQSISFGTLDVNTWYHLAAIRSSATITTFVNGKQVTTTSQALTMTDVGNALVIGNQYTSARTALTTGAGQGQLIGGYVSNLRIIKGTAIYTTGTNFTPPTDNLASITGTSLLINGATIADSSSNAFTITNTGTAVVRMENPFGDYSMSFNGSSQYLTTASSVAATGDFTVECWVYATAYTTNMGIWSIGSTEASGRYQLYLAASYTLTLDQYTVGGPSWGVITANAWNHIALVRSGTTLYLYVNGVLRTASAGANGVSSTTLSGTIGGTNGYVIGKTTYGPNAPWSGYISNFRYVNGSALYSSNFTPSTSALTAVNNTQLLTCQYAELYDASTNHLAMTNIGSTPASSQNPFGNYYASFNGTSQYLSVPYNANQAFGANDFTIESWIYVTDISKQGYILSAWYVVGGQFYIIVNSSGRLVFRYVTGSTTQVTVTATTTSITANAWYHIAVVRNGTTITLYVNGVADSTTSNIGSTALVYYNGTQKDIYIGLDGTTAGNYFAGYITNARIVIGTAVYTGNFTPPATPLAATQSSGTNISAITGTSTTLLTCQYANIVDASTNKFTITNGGTVQTYLTDVFSGIVSGVNYAQKNYSLKLNTTSTNQYVDTSHASNFAFGTGDFTVESWIYLDNSYRILPLESVGPMAWFGDSGANIAGIFIQMGTDRLSVSRPGYATNVYLRYPGATTGTPYLQNNTWYHLAVTRQSATWKIFLNGVQGTTDSAADYSINTTSVRFGGSSDTAYAFPGYISNMRVVKGVAVYTGAFTPPTSPLKATQSSGTNIAAITTQTSLLTCQYNTLFDASNNKLALTRTGSPDMVNMYPFPV
jgi:hypothetical protein